MEGHAAALNMGAGKVHRKLRRRYCAQPCAPTECSFRNMAPGQSMSVSVRGDAPGLVVKPPASSLLRPQLTIA
jgi:hypothetical protein